MSEGRPSTPSRPASPDVRRRAVAALRQRFPAAILLDFTEFEAGASSLTYAVEVREAPVERVVVKVAPAGLRPVANRDVMRQARVLRMLAASGTVPVPEVYGSDAGGQLDRPPLFVMSHEDGDAFEPATGTGGPHPGPAIVHSRGLAAARLLGQLHAINTRDMQLAAEPILTPGGEVERWSAALATCDDLVDAKGIRHVEAQLRRSVPSGLGTAITHGDYRLGNILAIGADIRAVIDWEIWSLNDPRTDLGWLVAMSDRRRADAHHDMAGVPTSEQLVASYGPRSDGSLDWFVALAWFKEIAVLSLILKRLRPSVRARARAAQFTRRIPLLVDLAAGSLASGDGAFVR